MAIEGAAVSASAAAVAATSVRSLRERFMRAATQPACGTCATCRRRTAGRPGRRARTRCSCRAGSSSGSSSARAPSPSSQRSPDGSVASIASRTPFVSGRRLGATPTSVASDSNATHVPAALRLGAALAPLPGAAAVEEASRSCGPARADRRPARSAARRRCAEGRARWYVNATMRPSTLLAGWVEAPAPASRRRVPARRAACPSAGTATRRPLRFAVAAAHHALEDVGRAVAVARAQVRALEAKVSAVGVGRVGDAEAVGVARPPRVGRRGEERQPLSARSIPVLPADRADVDLAHARPVALASPRSSSCGSSSCAARGRSRRRRTRRAGTARRPPPRSPCRTTGGPAVDRHALRPAGVEVAHERVGLAVGVAAHEVGGGGDERDAVRRDARGAVDRGRVDGPLAGAPPRPIETSSRGRCATACRSRRVRALARWAATTSCRLLERDDAPEALVLRDRRVARGRVGKLGQAGAGERRGQRERRGRASPRRG